MKEVGMIQRYKIVWGAGKHTELLHHKGSLNMKGEIRDINEFHKAKDHPSEKITHVTTHAKGFLLKGQFNCCEDSVLKKAKQLNVKTKIVPTNKASRCLLITSPIQTMFWMVNRIDS